MHPTFAELFIHTDEAGLLADEEQQRTRRARRNRSRISRTVRTRNYASKPRGSTG